MKCNLNLLISVSMRNIVNVIFKVRSANDIKWKSMLSNKSKCTLLYKKYYTINKYVCLFVYCCDGSVDMYNT